MIVSGAALSQVNMNSLVVYQVRVPGRERNNLEENWEAVPTCSDGFRPANKQSSTVDYLVQ
jgi:hypothetical protein